MNIVERMKTIEDLGYIGGCSESQIEEAEEVLGLAFPEEYKDYVRAFGCIDFGATEWTGLNIEGELNTVEATLAEKEYNGSFPEKFFVLNDYHIDNKKIIVNEKGEVFMLQYDLINKVCDSINDYLEICILNG